MKSKTQIGSAAQVASIGAGVYSVKNAPGLYLRKSEGGSGSGSWFFRYYAGAVDGKKKTGEVGKIEKRREKGLGSAIGPGAVTLAQAREKAFALRTQHTAGVPILTKKQERKKAEALARAEAKKITFRQATEAYVGRSKWKHTYARPNFLNAIVKYAYPVIGDMLLDEIGVEHVTDIIDAAGAVPDTASRVRQRIEAILNDATRRGQRSSSIRNPAEAKVHREQRPRTQCCARRVPRDPRARRRLDRDLGLGVHGCGRRAAFRGAQSEVVRDKSRHPAMDDTGRQDEERTDACRALVIARDRPP